MTWIDARTRPTCFGDYRREPGRRSQKQLHRRWDMVRDYVTHTQAMFGHGKQSLAKRIWNKVRNLWNRKGGL